MYHRRVRVSRQPDVHVALGFYRCVMITTRSRLFLLAGLSAMSSLGLEVSLRFPELLLDDPAPAGSLGAARTVASLASLLGLLAAGAGLVALARALTPKRRLSTGLDRGGDRCCSVRHGRCVQFCYLLSLDSLMPPTER
jgi:hypothetical protein